MKTMETTPTNSDPLDSLEQVSKAAFVRHAKEHGLALLYNSDGALWLIAKALDDASEGAGAHADDRCEVTGTPANMKRHTKAGRISYLRMGKDETVYRHKRGFWIVQYLQPEGRYASSIIYA